MFSFIFLKLVKCHLSLHLITHF